MKLIELQETCSACPSQWEGVLEDGRSLYARYRFGGLTVAVGATMDEAVMPDSDSQFIISESVGGPWDGVMSEDDLLLRLKQAGVEVAL